MRIFNQDKTQELFNVDETKGELTLSQLVTHHEAVQGTQGEFHYEVIREYPNGGKDVKRVYDVEPIEAKDAWDETEDILVYIPYGSKELRIIELRDEINKIQANLAAWDYKTSKHADGDYTEEEWANIVAQRKAWRAEINKLEKELESL